MSDSNSETGAAVAEVTDATDLAKTLSLFQIEESLVLLAESAEEEGLTPEIESALAAYLEGAVEKRDRVAEFIRFCEGMAELAKAEVKRLQAGKSTLRRLPSASAIWCCVFSTGLVRRSWRVERTR